MTVETWNISNPVKPWIPADNNAILDYSEKWTDWLEIANVDDVIVTFTAIPLGLVEIVSSAHDGLIVTAFLDFSNCIVGTTEQVTYRINTFQGRQDERTLNFKVKAR